MNNFPKKRTREYALADVLSRPNAMNGMYRKLKLPLEWENLNNKDAVYIIHTADLADEVIQKAIDEGKDLKDYKVQEELQAAVHGGAAGAFLAICYHKFLGFLGFRQIP